MWAEQAIFTSIPRNGKGGYHLVSRSTGISEEEATALATWAPSHGALIVDSSNATSVNFHPLPSGRLALSRTCEGPAEYSGRGERQLYTHAIVFDTAALGEAGGQPIAIYRDALALGYLQFQPEPDPYLASIELGNIHPPLGFDACASRLREFNIHWASGLREQLASGQQIKRRFAGDRTALAELLLGLLPSDLIPEVSFSTSLQPSGVRPYRLILLS